MWKMSCLHQNAKGNAVMLLCTNSNQLWHYLAGRYPGKVGFIIGPKNLKKQVLRSWMPFALDNDAYICWSTKRPWDEKEWIKMLDHVRLTRMKPMWCIVPDVVADRTATLENWKRYAPVIRSYKWPLAFAAQDGMTPDDVPTDADVVFIGGTTKWKWRHIGDFAKNFKRVHVGRVNTLRRLLICEEHNVESCDGSGWFRATSNGRQASQMILWIEGHRDNNMKLDI